MTNTDNSWNGIITTLEKHSYVNWRIHIVYENGFEISPERSEGYAKVWSIIENENQEIITGDNVTTSLMMEETLVVFQYLKDYFIFICNHCN